METSKDLLLYISCTCIDCGHRWESYTYTGRCPECQSDNITRSAMTRGL